MAAIVATINVGTTQSREVEDVYAVSVAVVAAVRVLAHIWREPAAMLALMVTTALLTVFLFRFGDLDVNRWQADLVEAGTENSMSYIPGLFIMEWLLAWKWPHPLPLEAENLLEPDRKTARP